jgi:cold shock CspA family protein
MKTLHNGFKGVVVKYQGRIQQWDDAKGYGFVEPNGGGTRAFTHIKAFKQRSRRPVNGDIIVYEVEQDRNSNHRACNISLLKDHKAKRLRANKPTSQRKRNVIVLSIFSGALALFTLSGRLPFIVPIVYGAVSLLTILFYGIDKSAAKKEKRRVSEAKLHILSLLGGWPGALLAQQMSIPIRIDNCPLRRRWQVS